MGNEIQGKTIGLVGLGQIGMQVAHLAQAFGMDVLAYDPYVETGEIIARGARPVSLQTLLNGSDVVSLHCPRNSETLGMIGAREFAHMRPGAIFISTARGGIHDECALYDALVSGHLAGAGLDVWAVEPPPRDHPLLKLPNVISTYHTAGVTHQGRARIARISAEQILDIAGGHEPPRMINPTVFSTALQRLQAGQNSILTG